MKMRKILVHEIRIQKNPQTKEDTFWIFKCFVINRFFYKKNAYFEQKFSKYLMELT